MGGACETTLSNRSASPYSVYKIRALTRFSSSVSKAAELKSKTGKTSTKIPTKMEIAMLILVKQFSHLFHVKSQSTNSVKTETGFQKPEMQELASEHSHMPHMPNANVSPTASVTQKSVRFLDKLVVIRYDRNAKLKHLRTKRSNVSLHQVLLKKKESAAVTQMSEAGRYATKTGARKCIKRKPLPLKGILRNSRERSKKVTV